MSATDYRYHLPDLHCESCERAVRRRLAREAQVEGVDVDLAGRQIVVHARASGLDAELRAALQSAGFQPQPGVPGDA